MLNLGARTRDLATMLWLSLLIVVATTGIYLRLTKQEVAHRTPDEQIYMAYATGVAESGVESTRASVAEYNRTVEQWSYPPPTRIGSIFLIARVMNWTGFSAENAALAVSRSFSLLGLAVLLVLGLRFFDRRVALIALAFQAVSPLDLALAGRCWQDAIVAGTGLLLLYLALEASEGMQPKRWRIPFWIVGGYFLLIKELSLAVYGLLVVWLVIDVWRRTFSWRSVAAVALPSGLVVVVSYSLLAWSSGGIHPLLQVYRHMAEALSWNQYVALYQRGPWYSFPLGLWVLSPATTCLCALGMGQILFDRKRFSEGLRLNAAQCQSAVGIAIFILAILTTSTIPHGIKNLRYVGVIGAPVSIMAGLFAGYLWKRGERRFAPLGRYFMPGLVAVGVIAVCLTDHSRSQRIFLQYQLDDLAVVRVASYALAAGSNEAAAPLEAVANSDAPPIESSRLPVFSTAESALALSQVLVQQGRYWRAIEAATEALRLKPGYAEAWNNIGAAYNGLGQFRKGAAACEEALRLKSDFVLARSNLQYARGMMEKNAK